MICDHDGLMSFKCTSLFTLEPIELQTLQLDQSEQLRTTVILLRTPVMETEIVLDSGRDDGGREGNLLNRLIPERGSTAHSTYLYNNLQIFHISFSWKNTDNRT